VEQCAGIDVSLLESLSVCVMDAAGRVVREGRVTSEPEALIAWLRQSGVDLLRLVIPRHPSPRSCQKLKQIPDRSEGGRSSQVALAVPPLSLAYQPALR